MSSVGFSLCMLYRLRAAWPGRLSGCGGDEGGCVDVVWRGTQAWPTDAAPIVYLIYAYSAGFKNN